MKVLKNINIDDKSRFYDSIFDFNSARYKDFTFENEYSWFNLVETTDTVTDALLNFPMISLTNDTSYLKNETGYVLLNFWSFSCPSCINNLNKYKIETDSLGYRKLEERGIKILAINYLSSNMVKMSEIANKTKTNDIIYSYKGMHNFFKLPYQGYYYLLSPSKEIIFETSNLGDYTDLLEAKKNYELNLKK